jgi:hypothetical protein
MSYAGYEPEPFETGRTIPIRVAGTDAVLHTTYYPSIREGSGRDPEIRMGRGLLTWIREGERLWLGTDSKTVFALKEVTSQAVTADPDAVADAAENLMKFIDIRRLLQRARASMGPPGRRESSSVVFERNPAVREVARIRSGARCEMPGCAYKPFKKANGKLYIEVHHVQSLAQQGLDILENVAAICPNCHAMAHYAANKAELEKKLFDAVHAANLAKGYLNPVSP